MQTSSRSRNLKRMSKLLLTQTTPYSCMSARVSCSLCRSVRGCTFMLIGTSYVTRQARRLWVCSWTETNSFIEEVTITDECCPSEGLTLEVSMMSMSCYPGLSQKCLVVVRPLSQLPMKTFPRRERVVVASAFTGWHHSRNKLQCLGNHPVAVLFLDTSDELQKMVALTSAGCSQRWG